MKYLFLLFFPILSYAANGYNIGTYVPYFNKTQVSNDGSRQTFELTPYFGFGKQIQMSGPNYFMPELGLAYYMENAKKNQKSIIFLRYDFSYILSQKFILRYGLTNHWLRISGDGGTVSLRNGSGYADFKAPDSTSTSYFTTLDLGTEYFLKPSLALRLDFNMMSFQNMENSAFNYILTVNFYR